MKLPPQQSPQNNNKKNYDSPSPPSNLANSSDHEEQIDNDNERQRKMNEHYGLNKYSKLFELMWAAQWVQ